MNVMALTTPVDLRSVLLIGYRSFCWSLWSESLGNGLEGIHHSRRFRRLSPRFWGLTFLQDWQNAAPFE